MIVKRVVKFNIKKNHIDYNYIKQQFLNSNKFAYQLISIVKNKEEILIKKIIKEFQQSYFPNNWKIDAVINSGLHKYLDKLLDLQQNDLLYSHTNYIYITNKIIETYGRNKDLDRFIVNCDYTETIINFGRNKDLDSFHGWNDNNICAVLRNGRYREIKHFLYDKNCNVEYSLAIAKTGIDRYIKSLLYDNILQEHILEWYVIQEITKHCSKKDLDYIMNKYKENSIKICIAERGYDDHINLLLSEKNHSDIRKIALSLIK